MTILPESIDAEDEIELLWERTPECTKVTASLGAAKITVECADGGEDATIVLVQSLSAIMNAAYDAMEEEEVTE